MIFDTGYERVIARQINGCIHRIRKRIGLGVGLPDLRGRHPWSSSSAHPLVDKIFEDHANLVSAGVDTSFVL